MVDFDRLLKSIVKSGKLILGATSAIDAAKTGKAIAFILASNCPHAIREEIGHYAALTEIPIHHYSSNSIDLGMALGKPFAVATITIRSLSDPRLIHDLRNPKT
jgi:large subunit ribosomal protein L30e